MKSDHAQKKRHISLMEDGKDTLSSSRAIRMFLENIWLCALPLCALLYLGVIALLNRYDLSHVPKLRMLQAGFSILVLFLLYRILERVFRTSFQAAKRDLEQIHHAKVLLSKAKSSLKRYSTEKQHHLRISMNDLKQALSRRAGLLKATHALETLLGKESSQSAASAYLSLAGSMIVAFACALLLRGFIIGNFVIPSGSMIPTLQIGDHIFVNQLAYGVGIPLTDIKFGTHLREPKPGDIIVFSDVEIETHGPIERFLKGRDLIKRVIAVAGDSITFCKGENRIRVRESILPLREDPSSCSYLDTRNYDSGEMSDWYYEEGCHLFTEENRGRVYQVQKTGEQGQLHEEMGIPDFVRKSFRQSSTASDCYSYDVPPDHVFVMGDNRDHSKDSRYFGPVPYDKIKGQALFIWWSDGATFEQDHIRKYARLSRMFRSLQ